jgi:GGDEF domain-containing protein
MSVLSFRQSLNELDHDAQTAMLQHLVAYCIQTTAQYAVELKSEDVRVFRENLERLAAQMDHLSCPADQEHVQDSFRGELRSYHHGAQTELTRMRSKMDAMIESVQSFMTNVCGSSQDLEQTLRQEFESLASTAESDDLDAIREAIRQVTANAIRKCEEFERGRESVMAQLRDEIRSLHKLVDHERRAALTDPVTGVWNRAKLDSRIKDLVLLNEGFCVFLVGLRNSDQITPRDPRLGPEVLKSLLARLHSISGIDEELGMTGRWSEEIFAVVFNLPLSGAPTTPTAMQRALNGSYAIQLDGESQDVSVKVQVQAIERASNSGETAFYLQLGQAAFDAIAR